MLRDILWEDIEIENFNFRYTALPAGVIWEVVLNMRIDPHV